jgi:hypothetical protein
MSLDADTFPTLIRLGQETGIEPEYLLLVAYLESRFTPEIHRSGTGYYGLTQISGTWLKAHGIDPTDFLTWPASHQFARATVPYFLEQMKAYKIPGVRSAGVLQAINLAPARVRDGAPGNVLYPPPQNYYDANKGVDVNKDGQITIGDLDALADALARQQTFQVELAKLRALRGAKAVGAAAKAAEPSLLGASLGGLAVGAVGYAAYEWWKKMRGVSR